MGGWRLALGKYGWTEFVPKVTPCMAVWRQDLFFSVVAAPVYKMHSDLNSSPCSNLYLEYC